MTNKSYRNYVQAFSQGKEHKKLYKAKKRWVVAGISFLALMGLGATANGNNSTLVSASSRKSVTRVHHHKARHQRRVTLHSKKEIKAIKAAKAKRAKKARIKKAKARKTKNQLRKMAKLGARKHNQRRNRKFGRHTKNLRHNKRSHRSVHADSSNSYTTKRRVRLPSYARNGGKPAGYHDSSAVNPDLKGSLWEYESQDPLRRIPWQWDKAHNHGAKFDGTWQKQVIFRCDGIVVGKGVDTFRGDTLWASKEKNLPVNVPKGYETMDGKKTVEAPNTGYNNHVLDEDTNNDGSVTKGGHNYRYPWNVYYVNVKAAPNNNTKPKQTTDAFNTVVYKQGSNLIGTEIIDGQPGVSATDAINQGLPSGYSIDPSFDVNGATLQKDGSVINVPLKQNSAQETLTYKDNGNPVGSQQVSGTGTGTVGNNPAGLPKGYKVANPDQTYPFNNGNTDVSVTPTKAPKKKSKAPSAPSTKTDDFKYMNGKKPEGHTDYSGNPSREKITLGATPKGITKGFYVPKKAANTVYPLDGKARVIQVKPSRYNIKDVNVLHNNQIGYYHGIKVQRLDMNKGQYKHFRWYKMNQRGAWIHTDILSVGHRRNYIFFMKPNKGIYHRITRIFRLNFGKHDKQIRYEFKIGNMNYFVTGNPEFTVNSYWQPSETNGHHEVKVIRPCAEYTSRYYNHGTHVKNFKDGSTVHIKGIINIGRKGDYQTRFIMDNGHYITANKNFVQLV